MCFKTTNWGAGGGNDEGGKQRESRGAGRGKMKELSIGTESVERARIVLTSLLAAIKNELETEKKQ